jgi:type VI secretion system protein ImpJ
MTKRFPIPLDINWHEGMLLSQHHFQQNDLRNFHIPAYHVRLITSNHFGVQHLRIDDTALSNGLYRISEIDAVFPDGLIFSFFPSDHKELRPLEIDVKQSMTHDKSEITIFIVIAEANNNTSPVLGNPARYYSLDDALVPDHNIRENEIRIPRLFPNAFLHIGDSIPESCTGFPLCKIIRTDGVFYVKNWTPPCFFIKNTFPLWKKCHTLTKSLREKAVFLSERLKNSVYEGVFSDTQNILSRIIIALPRLESIIYSNEIHPYSLYEELANVLGSVAVLIPTEIFPVIQTYNHNDIDSCLYPIIELIEHYVSTVERGFVVIQFNKNDIFFHHYLKTDDLDMCTSGYLYVGIKVSESIDPSDIENWMNEAVIVSDFAVDAVRVKRTKGAERKIMNRGDMAKLLPDAGVIIFQVKIDPNFIRAEQNIHIFNPGGNSKVKPAGVTLYIPRGKDK